MISTLKIKLVYGPCSSGDWEAVLEIESNATLDDLHYAIQKAVNFDNDHMYEFYIAREMRSRDRVTVGDEDDDPDFIDEIESLFPLGKYKKLFYWFDFGDDWKFQISRARKPVFPPVKGVKYPHVVSTVGKKPKQYGNYRG